MYIDLTKFQRGTLKFVQRLGKMDVTKKININFNYTKTLQIQLSTLKHDKKDLKKTKKTTTYNIRIGDIQNSILI